MAKPLFVSDAECAAMLRGTQTTVIRLVEEQDLAELAAETLLAHTKGAAVDGKGVLLAAPFAELQVECVRTKACSELSQDDAKNAGLDSVEALMFFLASPVLKIVH